MDGEQCATCPGNIQRQQHTCTVGEHISPVDHLLRSASVRLSLLMQLTLHKVLYCIY